MIREAGPGIARRRCRRKTHEDSMDTSDENPCVGICEIDESGYCVGCGRSADEIYGDSEPAPCATDTLPAVEAQPPDA